MFLKKTASGDFLKFTNKQTHKEQIINLTKLQLT